MRPIPIFDTNIFTHVQSGLITRDEWRRLRRQRPGHGWPLSSVTTIELLAGLGDVSPEKFPRLKERVEIAWNFSNGRVLEDPRYLICKDVLHIHFPSDKLPPAADVLQGHMDVVRRARSHGSVRVQMQNIAAIKGLTAGPKADWKRLIENVATESYPGWRTLFRETGRRLPADKRAELEPWPVWDANRAGLVASLLEWLGADVNELSVADMDKRLDALLRFTIFVLREFLLRDYNLDRHHSDIFDQFQLQYLAMDRFIVVSNDPDLTGRTSGSPQASRIMTFSEFLRSLESAA